jgi:hypothetical protein
MKLSKQKLNITDNAKKIQSVFNIRCKKKLQAKHGFTLLYSVLIASILLAIGLAIFNLTIKEFMLSSLGRESQFAFYAADTGVECALYWDIKKSRFSTSTISSDAECNGEPLGDTGGQGYGVASEFTLDFAPDEPYCAIVRVTKYESPRTTTVESRGYNTCVTTNPRRVERAIRVTY